MNSDNIDGCRVYFPVQEYAARENGHRLDGMIIYITEGFEPDDPNQALWHLYYHIHGDVYARVVNIWKEFKN
jgi:hypothetical protein